MALDFTGIENVEFYSEHYLSAVLEGDLKSVFQKWQSEKEESGARPPNEALASMANHYFKAYAKAVGEPDPVERLTLAQNVHAHLLEALGYERDPGAEPLEGNEALPVHLALRRDGNPFLWVVDAPFQQRDDDDPLAQSPLFDQLPRDAGGVELPQGEDGGNASWREILDRKIFRIENPPRWILFLSGSEALLTERHKWLQGKYLRFNLGQLFERKQASALRAMAGLLHRDTLAPDTGICLHDTLDENSHKHAYAVSGDLKHGVRRAVELLANEAVWYRRDVQKQAVFSDAELAGKLTAESLTWLYRMLFLFYVEARGGELGVVPMKADAYRKGYSLESLRDLELVPLTTEHARNGYYIHESLSKLFLIVNMGFPTGTRGQEEIGFLTAGEMQVDALHSPLFDDDRLDVLKNVRFRNHVLQEILQLLSLSAQKKKRSRGRISYAQLGINQLGAVYEGLLSYTGFFATEDLYEVAAEKDCKKLSGRPAAEREALKTYFVPASRIAEYKEGEIVKDENGKKVIHQKGTFIFRLAGRNREKSASYYTPEVLTQCLVKYALKELLWEEGEESEKPTRKKTADEILALTICEPAMGSSAFLIEAVDQLADAYLETRQEEKGETIPPEDYQREKRRVKARLATNNCYGVDLNPTAVELAKVSLWLATLHEDGKCPWFGLRLATGNSLVGARREVFKTTDVTRKGTKDAPNWLGLVPEPVPLHHSHQEGKDAPPPDKVDWANWTAPPRPKGTIYHFLLPAEGMAAFDKDKVIKELAPESMERIKEWRKEFCKPFNKKDAERLEQISDAVDRLFAQVVRERVLATQETSDRIPVWGEPQYGEMGARRTELLVRDQEEVAASLEDGSSAYRRLKLAMDAWCALWFWPTEDAELLPDRATWLAQMELILKGQVTHEQVYGQGDLFADLTLAVKGNTAASQSAPGNLVPQYEVSVERLKRLRVLSDAFRDRRVDYLHDCGLADIRAVLEGDDCLRAAQAIADRLHFHHWSLRFAEVFANRLGFDLILGNPPWVKLGFDARAAVSDLDPAAVVRGLSASDAERVLGQTLSTPAARSSYVAEFEALVGASTYLRDPANYRLLIKQQPNLYKCFIARSFELVSDVGAAALVHPQGIFDHAEAANLRAAIYPRLRYYFHFENQWPLFPEVLHTRKFALCVYGVAAREVSARQICWLYHPSTVDASFAHDGHGALPGKKNEAGKWEIAGHRSRIVSIDSSTLRLFSAVYRADAGSYTSTRMPLVFCRENIAVLSKLSDVRSRLADLEGGFVSSEMWHEKSAQTEGIIERRCEVPESQADWIYSGPHIYVANPLYQSANENCKSPLDYTAIDLESIADDYFPRTVYSPGKDRAGYSGQVPRFNDQPITYSYRFLARRLIDSSTERTLISAIIPPRVTHIDACFSVTANEADILRLTALCVSLPFDFWVKSTGKTNFRRELADLLPIPQQLVDDLAATSRVLRLSCVSSDYAGLWERNWPGAAGSPDFTLRDRRLQSAECDQASWGRDKPARSDLARRVLLLELDCISGLTLDMDLSELIAIYSSDFQTLKMNEARRLYDQHGRIVPTSKTAAGNPAVSLVELAATLKEQAGFDVYADYHPDCSNTQELRKQKIRLGKKEADVLGVSERCTMDDLLAETEVRWSDEDHPEGRPVRLAGLRYTDPGLEPRMERVYPTPWTRCDREADYRQAWAEFERRLGKHA